MLQSLQPIALSLVPVAFVIFLGWLAGSKKIIDASHSHSFATYVMSFSFPCNLFLLTATSNFSVLFNGAFVAALWLGIMGMFVVAFGIYKIWLKRPTLECAQGAFVCSFPDMAFMGIPIFTILLGKQALLSIAMGNICTSLLLIPIVTILLSVGREKKQTIGYVIYTVVTKPLVLAPIIGVLYSLAGWHLPEIVQNALGLMAVSTSGVSLFALGLIISSFSIRFNKLVGINIILKNIIQPLIMLGLVTLFHVQGAFSKEAVLLCAMPTAAMTTMFALKYRVLMSESTASTVLSTIVSLVSLAVFMMVVGI